jgi:purine-binding chemotaxis protein CheW
MTEGRRRSDSSAKSLVGFRVDGVHYAVDIMRVHEIVNPLPVVPVPHAPDFVLGVADHRGNVIPVVDLRKRFGLASSGASRGKWILASALDRDVGLAVDEVTQVFGRPAGGERPAPELTRGAAGDFVHGVCTVQDEIVFVLDLDRLSGMEQALAGLEAAGSAGNLPPGRG